MDAVSKGYKLTRVAMSSGCNYSYTKKIVSILIEKGLVSTVKCEMLSRDQRLILTEQGLFLCKLLDDLQYCLYSKSVFLNGGPQAELNEKLERARRIVQVILGKRRRHRLEIYFTILVLLTNSAMTLYSIANRCFLNMERARQYVEDLVASNLVEEVHDEACNKIYRVTSRGLHFINLFLKIYEMIHEINQDHRSRVYHDQVKP